MQDDKEQELSPPQRHTSVQTDLARRAGKSGMRERALMPRHSRPSGMMPSSAQPRPPSLQHPARSVLSTLQARAKSGQPPPAKRGSALVEEGAQTGPGNPLPSRLTPDRQWLQPPRAHRPRQQRRHPSANGQLLLAHQKPRQDYQANRCATQHKNATTTTLAAMPHSHCLHHLQPSGDDPPRWARFHNGWADHIKSRALQCGWRRRK